jgi:protein-tyrosine phosphatase
VIDTHCHILPFIDDGAKDWDASLAMARMAVEDGIHRSIATPHWTGAKGETDKLLQTAEELRRRLAAEKVPLKVEVGNEVVLVPGLVPALKEGRALTLGDSSYVLLETAQLEHGAYIHSALFQLQSSGYRIILAHPERVKAWQGHFGELVDLMQRGCYAQINAGSLEGAFGPAARKAAEDFLRNGWVSLLATDSHSPESRPPLLGSAYERCCRLIGEDRARVLVEDNPARVLCNEPLPYIDTDAPPRRPRFQIPWWPKR